MPKFVVVELADDLSTIDLLSFCVKRNFDRVSLLQRLEDYPYLRDDSDVHSPHSQVTSAGGCQSQVPQFNLSDDERNRLLKLISGNSGLAGMERVQIQHPNSQQQHLVVQHQIPSTSSYSTQNSFMYLKSDGQYTALKTDSQQQSQQQQQQQQQQSQSFEATVNSVAHAQTLEEMQNMQSMDVIRELFPTGNGASPAQGEVLRRKQPNRRPEESCKATCKICGHDVMYSPQRTWNLMRHVWIMHQSSKPNQCSACGYSHIKPYVRKHIESQHKQQNATILDLKSPELEAEWSALLDQCFGVTYRKWKHRKDENHVVQDDHSSQFGQDHFSTHQSDMQSKFVVVEVSSTPSTMSLVEYLVTHGFDKFAVVTDLCDHPSLKYTNGSASPESPSTTVSTAAQHTPPRTAISTPTSMITPIPQSTKPRISIDSIANALSKKSSPINNSNKCTPSPSLHSISSFSSPQLNNLTKLFEEQQKIAQQKKEQERQQAEIQRIILAQATSLNNTFRMERMTPDSDEHTNSETISKASSEDMKPDHGSLLANLEHTDFGLGPSDEQVRASMIHLLNPGFASAFGLIDENLFASITSANNMTTNTNNTTTSGSGSGGGGKRKNADGTPTATKKHRWLPVDELEESRSSRGKNCGRVHCKATYKCALCGKPTTLNSTGSRWNLLRHVIMIHSDCKPYKCWDCDFTGIKSNVISHARQCRHRADDAHDVTTDEMRGEWNVLLHECFPDYVRAKERGWQPEEPVAVATPPTTTPVKIELKPESPIKNELPSFTAGELQQQQQLLDGQVVQNVC